MGGQQPAARCADACGARAPLGAAHRRDPRVWVRARGSHGLAGAVAVPPGAAQQRVQLAHGREPLQPVRRRVDAPRGRVDAHWGALGRDVVVPEHRPAPAGGQLRHARAERPTIAHGAGGRRHLGRHVGGQGHAAELPVPPGQGGVLWRQAEPRDQERHGARHRKVHGLPRHARLHSHGAGPAGAPGARREAARLCRRGDAPHAQRRDRHVQ